MIKNKKPIILIHGYSDNPSTIWWRVLEKRLIQVGYSPSMIKKIDLSKNEMLGEAIFSPKIYVKKIVKKVKKMEEKSDYEKFDIIAHSMGGLISRLFIENYSGDKYIRKLITLGTPHQGTKFTILLKFTSGGQDMIPQSDLIKQLKTSKIPKNVEYYSIFSRGDYAIIPYSNGRLNKEKREDITNIRFKKYPHIMLVWSKKVFEEGILYALKD
ncbi:MAG: alpha/beta fold hydrolase [archaeon]